MPKFVNSFLPRGGLNNSQLKFQDVDDVEMFERRIHAMQTIGIKKEDLTEASEIIVGGRVCTCACRVGMCKSFGTNRFKRIFLCI